MTRKHGIRAPRIPPKEDSAVTIANQARQIQTLLTRCDELVVERNRWLDACQVRDLEIEQLASEADNLRAVVARMEGWRDCAREMLGTRLDSTAPGA